MNWRELLELHRRTVRLEPRFDMRPVQLGLRRNPWRILVACSLLNQTGIAQARPALQTVLTRWPNATELLLADGDELAEALHPLGLYVRRADSLRWMSAGFLLRRYADVRDLPGVGQYASDAIRIFCYGDTRCSPSDGVLAAFCRDNPNYEPEEVQRCADHPGPSSRSGGSADSRT